MAQINSIFNFLKDYNELSNPVITEIDKQKWNLKLSDLPQIKELWSIYYAQDFDGLKILEVKRPVLKSCPVPDESFVEWLDGDWKKLGIEIIQFKKVIVKEIINDEGNVFQVEEYFDDDKNRKHLFDEWTIKRSNWRAVEIPKEQGLILYNNLFRLYSDIKKESESVELILGDGYLHWRTDLRIIDHPVLLQRVQLEFDPEKPAFIVKCDELKTELYTPMLRIIPTINQSMLSNIIQDIETNAYHIADTSNTRGLFQRLINVVDEKGKCVEAFDNGDTGPMILSDPVLFLRKRTLGFSMFIQKIIEEIESKDEITIPDFFENMIGNYKEHIETEVVDENWNQNGIDQDVLLTLPANNEQLKIIKYLNNYGAVLVQGPPGTGKTHTIANLIGHLLSQGSSVLVTSHTEKALSVVKEKVYKDSLNNDINLQSLCISLLRSSSQKKEMDDAINEIAVKGTSVDLHESKKKIDKLENERKELINKSKTMSKEILQIRSLEYKDIVFANQTITPIEAAKFINGGRGKFDYIPGSTRDDTVGLPLSIEDLRDLYNSNQQITSEEDELLSKKLPALESLWAVDDFKTKADNYLKFTEEIVSWNPKLVLKDQVEEDILTELLETALGIQDSLLNMEKYQLAIIDKTIKDSIYNTFWTSVFEEFDALMENYEVYRKICFDNDYCIPDKLFTTESLAILNEIIDSGKETPVTLTTGVTKPKWKKFRNEVTISKKIIGSRADFENVKIIIHYETKRTQLHNKINKLLAEVSDDALTIENFEEKTKQYRKKIMSTLNWHNEVWVKFINRLYEFCLDQVKFEEISVIEVEQPIETINIFLKNIIIPDVSKRYFFELLNRLVNEWNVYASYLNGYKAYGQLFDELICAVNEKDTIVYTKVYILLSDILAKKEIYKKRCRLIKQLQIVAPAWSEAIKGRNDAHGEYCLPANIELAWKWRQLSNQIARIDSYEPYSIQKELSKINNQLLMNARKLAYEKAWYEKIKYKTKAQNQAIEGWRQTIKQIGKGTGKTAPTLLKKARELMPLCQSAIPVWIMSLNRVAESFDPQKNKFDVVIIDEASQADILALSALYLGKKVIIVGDDEQVSPDTVGMKTEEVNALIEQHLHGIPNNHLFNGKTSVYDIAKASGFKPLLLTEHFRCLPEIIEFSNQLSYNGRIKPLRDASGVKLKPSVIEYRVPNAYKTTNKINKIEAEYIASMICACVDNEIYQGKTIGVISLLGQEQAYEIERLLQVNLEPKEYESRRIQCGTASQFQGDERDIIFLSVVEGPSEKGGPVRLLSEDGRNDMTRKRYNVAASRAKDQMWVVHSLNPEMDLKPDDIRLRLIKHAINPTIDRNEEKLKTAESDFEKQVMQTLLNQGYKVIPQWKVGAYRIDMVIEDGDKRVALECDGEKWHNQDDLPNDLKRQAILERLGWKFIRIRGSVFYRNPEETKNWIISELDSHGISPNFITFEETPETESSINNETINRIKRRAEQIRREWHGEVVKDKINEEVNDEIVKNIQDEIALIETEKSDSNDRDAVNTTLEKQTVLSPKDKNIKTMTIAYEKVNAATETSPKAKKVTSLNPNQKSKCDIIKEEENNEKSTDNPMFDFRKDHTRSKNKKQVTNTMRPKEKIYKNESTDTEKNEKKKVQKPLFDFRKK
ncbi:MAG: hypothetical protein CVU87_07490 [Firmicutes bacterium HGW-Firmicutes-12]|jgi:superfamily I DNA and/or RNA helicase|nr:MAG: hypothetical protein CVU87_07490 [Firmicutes bacterium HGW-Firmicutes-12]